jgi:biopolymer transport protein ExbB/TolQ
MFSLLTVASGICLLLSVMFIVRGVSCPAALVLAIRGHLAQNNWQAVLGLLSSNRSYLARLLHEPLQHPHITVTHAFAMLRRRDEYEQTKVTSCVSFLALLAVLTFLTGLLANVDGIVISMNAISGSATAPTPSQWAVGIGMSGVPLLIGFWMSWCLILVYWVLRNIYRGCVSKTNLVADELLGLYLNVAAQPPADKSS